MNEGVRKLVSEWARKIIIEVASPGPICQIIGNVQSPLVSLGHQLHGFRPPLDHFTGSERGGATIKRAAVTQCSSVGHLASVYNTVYLHVQELVR